MGLIYGAVGGFVLFFYGIVPTFQSTHFHMVYASIWRYFHRHGIVLGLDF